MPRTPSVKLCPSCAGFNAVRNKKCTFCNYTFLTVGAWLSALLPRPWPMNVREIYEAAQIDGMNINSVDNSLYNGQKAGIYSNPQRGLWQKV